MDNPQPPQKKKYLLLAAGLLIGLALLWFAVKDTDWAMIKNVLIEQTNFWYSIPFVISLLVFFWFKSTRWGHLLANATPGSHYDRFAAVVIGYTGNLVLPAQLGELVRTYVLAKQTKSPAIPILTSMALERIFDLMTMLLFLVAAMICSDVTNEWMSTLGYTLAALILIGLFFCYIYVTHTQTVITFIKSITSTLPSQLQGKILTAIEQGSAGISALRNPKTLVKISLDSFFMWLAMIVCVYLALIAVDIHQPLTVSIFVLTVIIGGMMLPASPGFVGTIQFCFILVLTQYNLPKDQIIAASLYYHVLISLPILALGYALIVKLGFSAKQLQHDAQHLE